MGQSAFRVLKFGFMAVALVSLSACASGNFGGSSFGGSPAQIADISSMGNYTADAALIEARTHFRNNNFGYS
ncbi:MAG TPA: hypothetical protein ENJ90_06430, partial [Devosia sp.]|nr:hypothetical protein [Devosia sp.]